MSVFGPRSEISQLAAGNGHYDPRNRIVDMREAMRSAGEPLPYRMGPVAIDGFLTVLVGRRGEHKSWLAQFMCCAVHHDQPLGPIGQRAGRALYIDAEGGERLMARRFLITDMGPDAFVYAHGTGLSLPEGIDGVRLLVEHVGANLVVLDSLRRLAPGVKENDSDSVAPLVAELATLSREVGCATVAIHHRSIKPGAPNSRGSSALEDQADLVWQLEKVHGDPERRTRRRLRCTKMRVDEEPAPIWLSFQKVAGYMTVKEAEPFESEHDPDGDGEAAEQAPERMAERIRSVSELVSADGGWSPPRLAAFCGVTRESGTFKKALKVLLEEAGWEAVGGTRDRRYRPCADSSQDLGHLGQPLKEWPKCPNQTGSDDDPDELPFEAER